MSLFKKFLHTAVLSLVLSPLAVMAQTTGHVVILTWTAATDATATSVYNLYKVNGPCGNGVPNGMTLVGSTALLTYTDPEPVGQYCYVATHVLNGIESAYSNTSQTIVKPNPPTGVGNTTK